MAAQDDLVADEEGSKLLLAESGEKAHSWRLNFEGSKREELEEEKPQWWLHGCLGVLGQDRLSCFLKNYSAQDFPTARHTVIFHPLTGLCLLNNKLNGMPVLGSSAEHEPWNYTSPYNLVLKDFRLCLYAEGEDNGMRFGTACESSSAKWEVITDSQLLLSTRNGNNGSMVCLDIGSEGTIITSPCKCVVEQGSCNAEI